MAKFCGKCGSKLDEKTGLCPACNSNDINKTKELSVMITEKAKKKNIRVVIYIVVLILAFVLSFFTIKNIFFKKTWAEDYYKNVISVINDGEYVETVLNTDYLEKLKNSSGSNKYEDRSILHRIAGARSYLKRWHMEEYEFDYVIYDEYTLERTKDFSEVEKQYLSDKDREILRTFLVGEYPSIGGTPVHDFQEAFDYFYGENSFDITTLSNEEYFYISENGYYLYTEWGDELSSTSDEVYVGAKMLFKLEKIKYKKDEAVLSLKILCVNGMNVYDYVTGELLTANNGIDPFGMMNENAFETFCEMHEIKENKLGTAKLRIGKDGNNVYIIGWEGNIPGNW